VAYQQRQGASFESDAFKESSSSIPDSGAENENLPVHEFDDLKDQRLLNGENRYIIGIL